MKHRFIIQDVTTSLFFAHDAPGNWVENPIEADQFENFRDAEHVVGANIQENQLFQIQNIQIYNHYNR